MFVLSEGVFHFVRILLETNWTHRVLKALKGGGKGKKRSDEENKMEGQGNEQKNGEDVEKRRVRDAREREKGRRERN